MTGWTFLDTNVLVYAFDRRESVKQAQSQQLLASPDAVRYAISAQVLGEFYVTVTRKLAAVVNRADALAALDRYATLRVQPLDRGLVRRAIATAEASQISYWDALIVEAAVSAGCDRVLTEDLTDGQTINGVQIVNPFA